YGCGHPSVAEMRARITPALSVTTEKESARSPCGTTDNQRHEHAKHQRSLAGRVTGTACRNRQQSLARGPRLLPAITGRSRLPREFGAPLAQGLPASGTASACFATASFKS